MPVTCFVCPHNCKISEGRSGICGVRTAADGKLCLPFSGLISAAGDDPVEKKPLYHYLPGSSVFSIGFYGCSLSCPFCQNYRISKEFGSNPSGEKYSPDQIVETALNRGTHAIAYTYSEPIVHYEWIIECAEKASEAGLKNIMVTNGYINPEPGLKLLEHIDALNIDLKSFNDDFYRKELKAQLQPVKEFITAAAGKAHVELTTLVIPGKNDYPEELSDAADFIAGIDKNIPWHLSAYYPAYKYSIPPTNAAHLISIAEEASRKLNFVYTGNISGGMQETYCPSCGNLLISRSGYSTGITGIKDGCCSSCGSAVIDFGIVLK